MLSLVMPKPTQFSLDTMGSPLHRLPSHPNAYTPPSPQSRPTTADTETSGPVSWTLSPPASAQQSPVMAQANSPSLSSSTSSSSTALMSGPATSCLSSPGFSLPADTSNMDPSMVAEVLEFARDHPDVEFYPAVCGILETALSQIWKRVLDSPKSYVMSTHEFAVFNFFQHRFQDNELAAEARRRYWNTPRA